MEARLMLEKPAAGTRVAAGGGGAAVDCRAASAYAHHGPVLYKFLLDGGAAAAAEVHGGAAKGNRLHDGEKLGLRDQRDACCPGTLKRASPPRCGPPAPAALMHLDIRSPERAGELRAAPAERQPLPSSHIPVPRNRKPSGHADKEVMAATVLTSLSTSPLVLHPSSAPTAAVPEPASRAWKEVLSASYSSSTSGNWSWDASDQSVPSTPSPPLSNDNNKNFLLSPPGADDGGEDPAESTHFMFEDPIPRKRKNSMKVMFKCLWKNCEKVLSTSSGIQRHIRTLHLGRSSDSDYSDGEEDFYYSEIEVNMDSLSEGLSSLTPTSPTTAGPPPAFPPPPPPPPPPPSSAAAAAEAHHAQRHSEQQQQHVRPPAGHAASPLSQSAPSTLCHIRTDHAYQGPVTHVRTISIGEKRQPAASTHTTVNKSHALITPAAKSAAGNRKPRGEAKKCRKVYGMEKRDMWCTACRWKKACQRFTD